MGICYEIKMQDDFNWKYSGTTKRKQLNKFKKAFQKAGGYTPELIAEWYGHAIFDIGKSNPEIDVYGNAILAHCDTAVYWAESYHSTDVLELNKK